MYHKVLKTYIETNKGSQLGELISREAIFRLSGLCQNE